MLFTGIIEQTQYHDSINNFLSKNVLNKHEITHWQLCACEVTVEKSDVRHDVVFRFRCIKNNVTKHIYCWETLF